MHRRNFLRNTSLAGIGILAATPMEALAAYRKQVAPGDTIGVGLIGCKGMGWSNLTSMLKMPDVKCLALCDIDDGVLAQRKTDLDKIGLKPDTYKDYRKMLERKDIDVVIVATPDHWHCLQMVDACAAGKQVYVEKPLSNSIAEADWMEAAARRYGTIVQVNQWQRSQQHFKDAIAFVHSGKLGTVAQAKAWMYNGHAILPAAANEPVPAGVDYGLWLGPAQSRPFNKNRFHYNFRWYWDYAGGLMTDWGVHLIDMVLMGMQAGTPKSVVSMGGHMAYPTDARETPDTQTALFDYGNFQLTWEHTMGRQYGLYGMGHGIAFVGSYGTLLLNREGWEVRPEKDRDKPRMEAVAWQKRADVGLDLHTQNFIAAVKSKNAEKLACAVGAGAMVARHCHMGNAALRSGKLLTWNAAQNRFDDKEAQTIATPKYHNGWKAPKG